MTSLELVGSPIARFTRYMALLRKYESEKYSELMLDPRLDLKTLFQREITYRARHGRNIVYQVKGPTGSGKSIGVAIPIARMIKPEWRPKGGVFYTPEDMINASQKAARDTVILQDEDPITHGVGSGSVDDALANLESAVARFADIHYGFVNPGETAHLVHFLFDTSREEARYRDGTELLYSVVADLKARNIDPDTNEEEWVIIGKLELQVPGEDIVKEYKEIMTKFKNSLKAGGGFGVKGNFLKRYEHQIKQLRKDPDFQAIPLGRTGYFTEKHSNYISALYGIEKDSATVLLMVALKLIIPEKIAQ